MARSTKKASNLENKDADTPEEMLMTTAAEMAGTDVFSLQEILSERLGNEESLTWKTLPMHHEPLLAEIKKSFDVQASVHRLNAQETLQESPTEVTIPQEETPAPIPKTTKKTSTALTKAKSEAIKANSCKTKKLATTAEVLMNQTAIKKGQIKGTKKAILELQAEQATYDAIVAARLKQDVASLAAEIAEFAGFDPNEILSEAGINLPNEIYEDLQQTIEPKLNLLDESISEITSTEWLQSDFFGEMENLQDLLNSKISEIDC